MSGMAGGSVVDDYLANLVSWADGEPSVRGVIVMGSVAHADAADALSDLDLMVITTKPRRLRAAAWLDELEPQPLFSFTYGSPVGGHTVRQAVYDSPLVVDLAVVSRKQVALSGAAIALIGRFPRLRNALSSQLAEQLDSWLRITGRGTRVLMDKDGLAARMTRSVGPERVAPPSKARFLNTVHSLFGLVLWESKQLVRGELWMALGTVDQQVKQQLLTMMQWHSVATKPRATDTWYGGRHMARWLDSRWLASVPSTWPPYDSENAWSALLATLDLFSAIAKETAESLHYQYPAKEEQRVRSWLYERRLLALDDQ
jgi:hypothetical protein